jgi:hypothetical protein
LQQYGTQGCLFSTGGYNGLEFIAADQLQYVKDLTLSMAGGKYSPGLNQLRLFLLFSLIFDTYLLDVQ